MAQVIAVLLALLLIQILVLRVWRTRRRVRHAQFRAIWEPVLAEAASVFPSRLPRLRRRAVPDFLLLWSFLQESLREQAKERLNRVALRLGVDRAVSRLMRKAGIREKLIAVTAAGHLGEARWWDELASMAREAEPVLSLTAAKALVRIDAVRAAPLIVSLTEQRSDWPASTVSVILQEAGPDAISHELTQAVLAAPPERAPSLIRLLELAHRDEAVPVIRRMLEERDDTETVTACLRVVADPELLDVVRERLTDARWQIRLHAAQALGRMGTREDEWHLRRALADPQWWVRYRAAQALAMLPFIDLARLRYLSETVEDRYGRDILRQVIAERELVA